jgi:dynein heavy chain 2
MKVKDGLRSGQTLCEKWCSVCETLTGKLWKGYSPHPWRGDRYVPELLGQFAKRLEEVKLMFPFLESLVECSHRWLWYP